MNAALFPWPDRFWSHVEKTDTCWIWTGAHHTFGYGRIRLPGGRMETAHRVAWEMTFGPIPAGMWVLHNCPGGDNPRCLNPAHLWLGTADDNTSDRVGKRRTPAGERNWSAKVTADDVQAIRAARAAQPPTDTIMALARRYGVGKSAIHDIVERRTWRQV